MYEKLLEVRTFFFFFKFLKKNLSTCFLVLVGEEWVVRNHVVGRFYQICVCMCSLIIYVTILNFFFLGGSLAILFVTFPPPVSLNAILEFLIQI